MLPAIETVNSYTFYKYNLKALCFGERTWRGAFMRDSTMADLCLNAMWGGWKGTMASQRSNRSKRHCSPPLLLKSSRMRATSGECLQHLNLTAHQMPWKTSLAGLGFYAYCVKYTMKLYKRTHARRMGPRLNACMCFDNSLRKYCCTKPFI